VHACSEASFDSQGFQQTEISCRYMLRKITFDGMCASACSIHVYMLAQASV